MEPRWHKGVSIVAATLLFSGALTSWLGCRKGEAPASGEQAAAPVASAASDGKYDKNGELAAGTAAPAEAAGPTRPEAVQQAMSR